MYVIGARKEAVSSIVDIWLDVFVQVYSRTSHHTGDEWKDEISMKLFTQRRKGFAVLISLALFALIMSACGAGGGRIERERELEGPGRGSAVDVGRGPSSADLATPVYSN